MKKFRITFTHVGLAGRVDPLVCDAAGPADLAWRVHDYASRYLASGGLVVDINLTAGTGELLVGLLAVGHFTVEELAEVTSR